MLRVYCLMCLFAALDAVHVVPVHLVSEVNTRYRARRDVPDESMPDQLTFQMNFQDKPVTLRLRQSELLSASTNDPRTTLHGHTILTDSAVYTDPSLSSAVIVRRSNGQYNLAGKFHAFGNSWDIEPHEGEAITGNSQLHKISNSPGTDEQLNLGDDALHIEKADEPELDEPAEYTTYDQHPGDRRKRALTNHVVEMTYIIEYNEYLNWTLMFGDIEGMSQLRLWYSFVAESINFIYQGINDTDISISTKVTFLKVLTTPEENSFLDNVTVNGSIYYLDGGAALKKWIVIQLKNKTIPWNDHYMLFAKERLFTAPQLGLSYIGTTCINQGVSILTNTPRYLIPYLAAHELGHSLGSNHDGDKNNCSSADQFIMASSVSTTAFVPAKFSSCSISYFKSYLSKYNCTRPENTSVDNLFPTPVAGQRAGEIYSKDEQCQIFAFDKLQKYCPLTINDTGICKGMRCCQTNSSNTCGTPCRTVRPLDYTNCGVNKACLGLLCIAL